MNILLLGAGAQGKACLFDLLQNPKITSITVVENDPLQIEAFLERYPDPRIYHTGADANNDGHMLPLMAKCDIIIDLLPTLFRKRIAELAIKAKRPLVNTSFQSHIEDLHPAAQLAGIPIMPEAGLDPGIDLILAGKAIQMFDEVHEFHSACGGIPAPEACDNPINYKISWLFEGVLSAYKRPADIIRAGEIISIDGEDIFHHTTIVNLDGIGRFERYPNGYASTYAKFLGIHNTVRNMGRYTLRWPGHASFWRKIVELGLIDDDPVLGISPRIYFSKVISPKLQYKDSEQDMIVLRNEISGIKDGRKQKIIQQVVDKRDLKTGFMAMNRTVGFTASIIAQMILNNNIKGTGILNPAKDVPCELFNAELKKRNIEVEEKIV